MRSFGTARRSLVASLFVVIALFVVAAPAGAKPNRPGSGPSPSTWGSVTLVPSVWYPDEPCTFDVEYHWGGYKARDLTASIQLVDSAGVAVATLPPMTPVSGNGWALFFVKFSGSVTASRDLSARASLLSGGTEIAGSAVTSPPLSSTCGGPYRVAAPNTVGLS